MPFPVSPNPGDSYTDAYGTVWIYAGSVNGWYRQTVVPNNDTTYTGGGSGSATATGAAGEIQFTDGTNLAASPNLVWDDANDELEVTGDLKLLDGGSFTTTLQTITPTANRTVSIPDATGTLALVAGSSGQPVYNNAGAYAGLSTATIGATGNITLSLNGAASTPPVSFTGTWFTGGTGTTTKPQLLIEPAGTTSTAWSTSGTGLGVNAASGFAGRLLDLQLNGTSNFNVDSTGRVSYPAGTAALPALYPGTDTNTGVWSPAADTLAWSTNGVERTRIDSSGRFLVGTSSSRSDLVGLSPQIQLEGSTQAATSLSLTRNEATSAGPALLLAKSRGTTAGAVTVVQNNDLLGGIYFMGADGTNVEIGAQITGEVDGAPGNNDLPSRLVFSTTADGASSPTERMRIKSNGTINFSNVAVYADNTAALAGGLVAGDVYRKSDGTLMITY